MKRLIAILLAFIMVVTGVYVTNPKVEEVKASETSSTSKVAEGSKLDMLTIKMQMLEETYDNGDGKERTDLRIVSSVDSLEYAAVGFKIWYSEDITNGKNGGLNEKPTVSYRTKKVLERIEAGTVEYGYSPKVIDTSSEYFVTATLKGILKDNFNENFYIKVYYESLDGTVVEGGSRFFNLTTATSSTMINIPVEMTKDEYNTMSQVKVADTPYTVDGSQVEKAYYDGKYAHLNINVGDKTVLNSASLVQVGTAEDAPTAIYRNLDSTKSNDTSWYHIYAEQGEKEFVIATEEELFTLAQMSKSFKDNTNNFYGLTVYLVKDMEMNTFNTDGTWNTKRVWPLIGKTGSDCSVATSFNGIFDGQGHRISGIYSETSDYANRNAGFFTRITSDTTVKNVTLANSYIKAAQHVGAIGGWADGGTYQNIHIEDTVTVIGQHSAAGVVGVISSTADALIENCWFEGHVYATNTSGHGYAGGLVGNLKNVSDSHRLTVSNCLVEGTVTNSCQSTGGVCGYVAQSYNLVVENTVTIPTMTGTAYVGGVIGMNVGDTTATTQTIFNNVYRTAEKALGYGVLLAGSQDASLRTSDDLKDKNAFVNTMLNFESDWTVVDEGYPQLRVFVPENEEQAEPTDVNRAIPTDGDITWTKIYAGSEEDPYILKDGADLVGLAKQTKQAAGFQNFEGKYFVLANDITVNYDNSVTTNRLQWPIIGVVGGSSAPQYSFQGSFDGAGHTISGIYFQSADDNYRNAGLFSRIPSGATVKNFSMENSYIESKRQVGAVAGWSDGGTYENIHIKDSVTVKAENNVGGFVGRIAPETEASFEQCVFEGNVEATATSGGGFAGGMIGQIYLFSGTPKTVKFNNCFVGGTITNGHERSGGVCGSVYSKHAITIENVIAVSTIKGNGYVGGVIGMNAGDTAATTGTILNNVYTTAAKGVAYGNLKGGSAYAGLETTELQGNNAFVNTMLDFENIWTVVKDSYPQLRVFAIKEQDEPAGINRAIPADGETSWKSLHAGTETDPYILEDVADLVGLAKLSASEQFEDSYFKLANDIVVNYNNDTDKNRFSWIPIGGFGDNTKAFKGNFDGQEYTISGIYYNNTSVQKVGFFGRIGAEATIENFSLSNSNIIGQKQLGAVVGWADGGIYRNIYVADSVRVQAGNSVAGFVGRLAPTATTTFEQCVFEGNVEATGGYAGGMIGWIYLASGTSGKVIFNQCTANGSIKGASTWASGYCGYITKNSVDFLNCKFGGVVTNTADENGGFIGAMENSTIAMRHCQADGTVTGTMRKIGGFIGTMKTSTVSMGHCLSIATVETSNTAWNPNAGGFVGYVPTGNSLTVSQSLSVPTLEVNWDNESISTYGPIVGYSDSKESTVIYDTYTSISGKGNNIIRSFEVIDAETIKGSAAETNMPLLDWNTDWQCVEGSYPTLLFNATSMEVEDVTASSTDLASLTDNYPDTLALYQGELHAHAKTYGNGQGKYAKGDDGNKDLATWKEQMSNLNLDFAASLDHNQTHHINYVDQNNANNSWDISKFIYGTEAGTTIKTGIIGTGENDKGELHYNMIFANQTQLETVLKTTNFGFNYNDSTKKFNTYPDFASKAAFDTLIESVKKNGGFFVHVHPSVSSFSSNPLDYWFGKNTAYTGFEVLYKDKDYSDDTNQNDAYTESNYTKWNTLLKEGYRLYATAGSDTHGDLNTRALTSIYSDKTRADADKGEFLTQLTTGNFSAGSVGIQMCIGNTPMGSYVDFAEGQKLVVNIGKFHSSEFTTNANHKYRVDVVTDQGVTYSQKLDVSQDVTTPTNGTFALPVDDNSKYYRVEVYDTTSGKLVALGNPIWNGEVVYE